MLTEFIEARQVPGEGRRRWFSDIDMDLIVWYGPGEEIFGFQLCYNKTGEEHAFTWRVRGTLSHDTVDTGEIPGAMNRTPILVADGYFPRERVAQNFWDQGEDLEPSLRDFVFQRILDPEKGRG